MNDEDQKVQIDGGDAAETKPVDGEQETGLPEETGGLPSDDSGVRERPNHTAEMAENQGKADEKAASTAAKAPAPKANLQLRAASYKTAEERLDARIRDIEDLLIEKESHQMHYVYEKWPLPYYNQWKDEANELVALLVGLKHRRRAMSRKAG